MTRGTLEYLKTPRGAAVAAKLSALAAGLSRRLGGGEAPPEGLHNKLIIKGDEPNEHR